MVTVMTIAGSDPSGGAGIQADLRVFLSQQVSGISALTAVTVQNSQGVQDVLPLPGTIIAAQLESLFADSACAAVKIGLLPSIEAIAAVAQALELHRPPNIVLDPVLRSTSGVAFLDAPAHLALCDRLLPLCDLFTPNLPEVAALLERPVHSVAERKEAAKRFQRMGARAVLIKGGHLPGDPEDLLLDREGHFHVLPGRRIQTSHAHGTGCFLSSAIAARLALGDALPTAAATAKALLTAGLERPIIVGMGAGYPDAFAAIVSTHPPTGNGRTHGDRIRRLPGLYVLTDPALQGAQTAECVMEAAFAGGASTVQLRDKRQATPHLLETARRMNSIARQRDRLFIVNDRVDVALAADADGVHVGPDDLPPSDARRLLGPDLLLGVSVGTLEEARAAAPFASYLAVGAIFGSRTKLDAGAPVGPGGIQEIRSAVPHLPIVAIGGIDQANINEVLAAGAVSAAVVSAVLSSPDIRNATQELAFRFPASSSPGGDSPSH